jgi:hypothetical protein
MAMERAMGRIRGEGAVAMVFATRARYKGLRWEARTRRHFHSQSTFNRIGWNTFTLSGTLAPGAYRVVTQTAQWLDNTGESLTLKDSTGATMDASPPQDDSANDTNSWQRVHSTPANCQFVAATTGNQNP